MLATQISTVVRHTPAHMAAVKANSKARAISNVDSRSMQRLHSRKDLQARPTVCRAATEQQTQTAGASTEWFQKIVQLPAKQRGCHIITRNLLQELPELGEYEVGMANLFVMHTSASLTINENASSDVPLDLNDSLDRIAPEGPQYRHADEGSDDMPAHVKSSLMGASLNIPVRQGHFAMGTWQGLYLNEHRNHGGSRKVCVTIQGQKRNDGRKYPASRW